MKREEYNKKQRELINDFKTNPKKAVQDLRDLEEERKRYVFSEKVERYNRKHKERRAALKDLQAIIHLLTLSNLTNDGKLNKNAIKRSEDLQKFVKKYSNPSFKILPRSEELREVYFIGYQFTLCNYKAGQKVTFEELLNYTGTEPKALTEKQVQTRLNKLEKANEKLQKALNEYNKLTNEVNTYQLERIGLVTQNRIIDYKKEAKNLLS